MAKQSGIHQLRGKVGDMSYYRQAGVESGLVRRINEGMSARVKNSPEYANTRLNNEEFRTAAKIAAGASHSVIPAWRSMFRRFAQANMVKRIQEQIKMDTTHSWGNRMPAGNMGRIVAEILENYAKAGQYQAQYGTVSWTPQFDQEGGLTGIQCEVYGGEEQAADLLAKGINGINLYSVGAGMFTALQDGAIRVAEGHSAPTLNSFDVIAENDFQETVTIDFTPQGIGFSPRGFQELLESDNGGMWAVVSIVPTRRVGNTSYELQELATYVAFGSALLSTD